MRGTYDDNQKEIFRDARIIIEKLGPSFIKMGQMFSIRPDLIGEDAMDELTILQDNVKAFPTEEAYEVIC